MQIASTNYVRPTKPLLIVIAIVTGCAAANLRQFASAENWSPEQAADFLRRDAGLSKISGGNLWLVPEEQRLQRQLGLVSPRRSRIVDLQKRLSEAAAQNKREWLSAMNRIAALQRAKESLTAADKKRLAKIDREIQQLRDGLIPPDQFGKQPAVSTQLIALTNQRLALTISFLEIDRLVPDISKCYANLKADRQVADALSILGPAHRLGPMATNYVRQAAQLEPDRSVVFTNWCPVYWQADRVRVGGVLMERLPVNFTWQDSHDPTIIPHSIFEAAGLQVDPDLPTMQVTVGDARNVAVRPIRIAQVRFGAILLQNVDALLLPPNREDLGARIGRAAFEGFQIKLEPDRLRLTIDPP